MPRLNQEDRTLLRDVLHRVEVVERELSENTALTEDEWAARQRNLRAQLAVATSMLAAFIVRH